MSGRLRVIVLGEGKDERGPPRSLRPFSVVPRARQGAMEILVRRKLFALLYAADEPWYAALDDGIDIIQPGPTFFGMVQVLSDPNLLSPLIVGALIPAQGVAPKAELVVVTHDKDAGLPGCEAAVLSVNHSFSTAVPLLSPAPEIQSWLTSKRAVERAYGHEHCTVPEVDEELLKADAKMELERLLAAHGDKFSARKQAELAEVIALDDILRFAAWSQWPEADHALATALLANRSLE